MEIFSGGIWRYFDLPKRDGSTLLIPNSAKMRRNQSVQAGRALSPAQGLGAGEAGDYSGIKSHRVA